jgi:hypothetical protein
MQSRSAAVLHCAGQMSTRLGPSTATRFAFVLAACLYCVGVLTARQDEFSGRVVTVVDGDTTGITRGGGGRCAYGWTAATRLNRVRVVQLNQESLLKII